MKSNIYKFLLLIFPFLALFGTPVSMGLFYLTPTEIVVYVFGFIYLLELFTGTSKRISISGKLYWVGLIAVQFYHIIGLLNSSEPDRLDISHIRITIKPILIILTIFVLHRWLSHANMNKLYALVSLASAIVLAGLAGLYGMYNPDFAEFMISNYTQHILDADLAGRFNMSIRAMSVFAGYDMASIVYSLNIFVLLSIIISFEYNIALKTVCFTGIIIMLVSIVSSARTGFITTLAALTVYLLQLRSIRIKSTIQIMAAIACISFATFWLAGILLPNSSTLERFSDVWNLLNFTSDVSMVERSEGFGEVYSTQMADVRYPQGIDVILGLGDNARFISDSGYVSTYVKYGLLGLLSLALLFLSWIVASKKAIYTVVITKLRADIVVFNLLLLVATTIFIVAAVKGPLYFLSNMIGDIMAYIIACSIIELYELQSIIKAR